MLVNKLDSRNTSVSALSLGELLFGTGESDPSEVEDGGSGPLTKGEGVDPTGCPDKDNCTPPQVTAGADLQ
ncbi:MAG: hypothetical protein E6J90_35555 [Deltaproteobacteria bacterium]|nr:MAG: hypothetical protein E6J90_35555 [Deltaproteobacteria bacterium]TMQ18506.1 MAG: hypothetical protein E6J91_07765 [Deltaproteobacteria bacterium]